MEEVSLFDNHRSYPEALVPVRGFVLYWYITSMRRVLVGVRPGKAQSVNRVVPPSSGESYGRLTRISQYTLMEGEELPRFRGMPFPHGFVPVTHEELVILGFRPEGEDEEEDEWCEDIGYGFCAM